MPCAHVSRQDHEKEIPVFRMFQVLDPRRKLVNIRTSFCKMRGQRLSYTLQREMMLATTLGDPCVESS